MKMVKTTTKLTVAILLVFLVGCTVLATEMIKQNSQDIRFSPKEKISSSDIVTKEKILDIEDVSTLWENIYFHEDEQDARDLAIIADEYFITGRSTVDEQWQPFLLKSNFLGDEVWFNEYGPWSYYDSAWGITSTSDGGLVMCGKVQHSGPESDDILLHKVDNNGNTIWHEEFDMPGFTGMWNGFDRLWHIFETEDEDLIGCGTVLYDENSYYKDAGLLKFNSTGDLIWDKHYGSRESTEVARYCDVTSEGGFIIGGYYGFLNSEYENHFYIIKTNSEGEVEWEETYGDSNYWNMIYWIKEASDGNYVAAGSRENSSGTDAILFKVDSSNGDVLWERTFGGEYLDSFRDGVIKENDEFLMVGSTQSYSQDPGEELVNSDAWVVEINQNGDLICQGFFGGEGIEEYFSAIEGALAENYVITGGSSGDVYSIKINSTICPNQPPYEPSNPSPANNQTNVPLNSILTWVGGDHDGDPVFYDIYLGESESLRLIEENVEETTYAPVLDLDTTYYWKIIAHSRDDFTEGNIWRFKTQPEQYNYIPGDVNNDGRVSSADVTYLVNYFRGQVVPPFSVQKSDGTIFYPAADTNGDCDVLGSDVTYLVRYLRGLNELKYCGEFPPNDLNVGKYL